MLYSLCRWILIVWVRESQRKASLAVKDRSFSASAREERNSWPYRNVVTVLVTDCKQGRSGPGTTWNAAADSSMTT